MYSSGWLELVSFLTVWYFYVMSIGAIGNQAAVGMQRAAEAFSHAAQQTVEAAMPPSEPALQSQPSSEQPTEQPHSPKELSGPPAQHVLAGSERFGDPRPSLARATVNGISARHAYGASAAMMRTEDEMMGTLLEMSG
jgi:hypothetical protein